jgi:hypothetical protein
MKPTKYNYPPMELDYTQKKIFRARCRRAERKLKFGEYDTQKYQFHLQQYMLLRGEWLRKATLILQCPTEDHRVGLIADQLEVGARLHYWLQTHLQFQARYREENHEDADLTANRDEGSLGGKPDQHSGIGEVDPGISGG